MKNPTLSTSARFLILAAGLTTAVSLSQADTRRDYNSRGEPGANDFSFLRDQNRAMVTRSDQWVNTVTGMPSGNWTNGFDIVMQQCFGGGFLNPSKALPKVTFASAAAHDEAALNTRYPAATTNLDNFTRAWAQSARYDSSNNMYNNYDVATNGLRGLFGNTIIAKDPWARSPAGLNNESPQYYGKGNNIFTPDGGRTMGGTDPAKRYAILTAFSNVEARHEANIMRMYRTLRDSYNVPAANIVVLTGNHARGDRIGGWGAGTIGPLETAAVPSIFVDGPNTRAAFRSALNGDLFTGAAAGADAELFMYTTGHGGHGRWYQEVQRDRTKVWTRWNLTGAFNTASGIDWGSQMIDSVLDDSDRGVQVQVSSTLNLAGMLGDDGNPILITVQKGDRTATFDAASALISPGSGFDMTSLIIGKAQPEGTQIFDYSLRLAALGLDDGFLQGGGSDDLEVSFDNLPSIFDAYRPQDILTSVMLASGDQEYAHIVPTPGSLALLGVGGFLLRRRKH